MVSGDVVWVAVVPLFYEVMAVGRSEEEAITVACEAAFRQLAASNALFDDTDSPAKVREYWSVYATAVEIGSATRIA